MERVCPVCNGLRPVRVSCKTCSGWMQDGGRVSEYLGPYSPYELSPLGQQESEGRCTHLLICSLCRNDAYLIVQSESI